jgi:uncharacterized protein YigA (DUF484 family)
MNEREVADYLLADPDFFARHAELLATVKLASPHGNRAVSLQERQMEMLRDKNKHLERRLAEMTRHGHENDSIVTRLTQWTTLILSERDAHALPDTVARGLRTVFDVPAVALRLWDVAEPYAQAEFARNTGAEVRLFAQNLSLPYCGVNAGFEAAQWLTPKPGESAGAEPAAAPEALTSLALIALRQRPDVNIGALAPAAPVGTEPVDAPPAAPLAPAFGLLALGSPDPRRFHDGMSTDFLELLGALASAALSRLLVH